jgi:hypothetical protein
MNITMQMNMAKLTVVISALVCLTASFSLGGAAEDKMLAELNLARTQPAKYAAYVEKHKKRFIDEMAVSPRIEWNGTASGRRHAGKT